MHQVATSYKTKFSEILQEDRKQDMRRNEMSIVVFLFCLTEIGAVVLNFLPRSKILNRPTVSTHYRIQKYVKKICLHKLIVEIALFVYIFVKFRNRIIRVKKI